MPTRPPAPSRSFTDIEGSTRLWKDEALARAVARHDAALRAAIEAQGGYVQDRRRRVCAAFRAADAALAAAASPRAISTAGVPRSACGWPTPARPRTRHDYFGPCVNRVARQSLAWGQILVSAATGRSSEALPAARVRDLGDHRLKDLQRAERLHQARGRRLPTTSPTSGSTRSRTTSPAGDDASGERESRRSARRSRPAGSSR
jgi:class 3 adenylate cyclase